MHVGNKGVTGAYGEFRYEWRTKWDGWAVLTEYDGGIDRGTAYGEAILGGMCYRWDSPDFTRGYSLSVVYKYIPDNKAHHNFQVGGTWDFGMGKVVETRGFAKIWREYLGENGGEYHVWMEPQVWWNVGSMKQGTFGESNLSLGSEVAIRYSFGIAPSFYAIPSVAIRFTF
jgi:hypothetical protein